jgi:hypothetical protein
MTPFPGHPDGCFVEGAALVFPDLDLSEMRKTDGGLTCLSLLF